MIGKKSWRASGATARGGIFGRDTLGHTSFAKSHLVIFVLTFASIGGYLIYSSFATSPPVPRPDHVVVVMEENHSYNEIIGSSSAPYINSLASQGALFTNSFAINHPSERNYLELFSGSNQGVTTDSCPNTFSTDNLGAELVSAGDTFNAYSETLPSVGFMGCTASGSGSGSYARKHAPWTNFTNIDQNLHLPFTSFPSNYANLPTVSFVVPNLIDDMHTGTIQQGDTWLQNNMDGYAQWAKTHNSLLIVTWDEDDKTQSNQIPTIFVGQQVQPGQYNELINHHNVLRTIEDMYGLGHAGAAATATPITDVWGSTPPPSDTTPPTVAVTQPTAGATVSGTTTTISATASDNVGVVGVQFVLDGTTNINSEITSAPYQTVWNTTTASDGTHTITAVARDAAGNIGVSSAVTVTVNNAPPPSDTTPPSVPTGLNASGITTSSVNLAWNASTDNLGGSGLAGYNVYRNGTLIGTTTSLSLSDTSLSPSTTYSYTVTAVDNAGNESAHSSAVSATTNIEGDTNGDGHDNIQDLSILLTHFGQNYPPADFDNEGTVDLADLSILLSNFGN